MFEIILINVIFGYSVLHINPNIDLGCEFFLEKISQNDLSIQSESKKNLCDHIVSSHEDPFGYISTQSGDNPAESPCFFILKITSRKVITSH